VRPEGPDQRRLLDDLLISLECRALLVLGRSARDPDLAPFTGPIHLHGAFLVAPRGEAPSLAYLTPMEAEEAAATGLRLLTPEDLDVARWAREGGADEEMLASILEIGLARCGLAPGRLALAGHMATGTAQAACRRLEAEGWSFVPGHNLVRRLRKPKPAAAVDGVRRAAKGAMEAMARVAGMLARARPRRGLLHLDGEPMSVALLRRQIARTLAEHGLEQPEGNIVAAGAEGATPHTAGNDETVIRSGESLVVDLFPRSWLFADCSRTFCVGPAPPALVAAHRAALETLQRSRSRVAPGARAWDLQEAACQDLQEAGYPTPLSHPGTTRGYVHGLGHGVGWELHEYPSFRRHAGEEGTLEHGDILTLEPGIYEPEEGFGVRLEDTHYLGPEGLENLTPLPYELDPVAWRR
jgi:Xaa-Pro aminopeptidase